MPLVFFIVLIVWFVAVMNDKLNDNSRMIANAEYDLRKTNCEREIELTKKFYEEGHHIEEASTLAKEQITKEGFVPCVPIEHYLGAGQQVSFWPTSEYDSFYVREIKKHYRKHYPELLIEVKDEKTGVVHHKLPPDLIYGKDYPKNAYAMNAKFEWMCDDMKVKPVGTKFTYPRRGVCQITAIRKNRLVYEAVDADGKTFTISVKSDSIRWLPRGS